MGVLYGDILEYDVEAIAVPQLPLEGVLCEFTRRVYEAAGFRDMTSEYRRAWARAEQEDKRRHPKFYDLGFRFTPSILVTPGLKLNAKYVIHITVSETTWWNEQPKFEQEHKEQTLYKCYQEALDFANRELRVKSIALPLLGTSFLGFPQGFSRTIAERAIRAFSHRNIMNLARERKTYKEGMEIYLVIPLTKGKAKSPKPETDAYDNTDIFLEYERTLADKTKKSGLDRDAFFRKTSYEYLNRIDNDSKMAELLGFGSDVIHRFKSKQSGSGKGSVPKKWRVIALAVGLGLDDYERFEFIRCAGYEYPAEDLDFQVEKILRSGPMGFVMLNEKLCKINPEYDLTKPAKKQDDQKNK